MERMHKLKRYLIQDAQAGVGYHPGGKGRKKNARALSQGQNFTQTRPSFTRLGGGCMGVSLKEPEGGGKENGTG